MHGVTRLLRRSAWNRGPRLGLLLSALLPLQVVGAASQVVYFLVGDLPGKPPSHESYVLPLSRADDIAHARDLIARGPAAGQTIVVAFIGPNVNGINRNYQDPRFPQWPWEVTNFVAFADNTIEILDGRPSQPPFGSEIGFWGFTVVRELGPAPLYAAIVPTVQGLHIYWSGLGTNWAYTLESSGSILATNWAPIAGVPLPLKTNHWLIASPSGSCYYRVKAHSE